MVYKKCHPPQITSYTAMTYNEEWEKSYEEMLTSSFCESVKCRGLRRWKGWNSLWSRKLFLWQKDCLCFAVSVRMEAFSSSSNEMA